MSVTLCRKRRLRQSDLLRRDGPLALGLVTADPGGRWAPQLASTVNAGKPGETLKDALDSNMRECPVPSLPQGTSQTLLGVAAILRWCFATSDNHAADTPYFVKSAQTWHKRAKDTWVLSWPVVLC